VITVVNEAEMRQASMDMAVEKRILETLHKHYPDYPWGVKVRKGRASIKNMATSGEEGYAINFDTHDFSASNLDAAIVRAGGEVLERFGLRRGVMDGIQVAELKNDRFGKVLQQ
jgi:hypothetical protein